jgi:two-component system, OmpR family, flagellar system response regulator FtcR
MYIIVDERSVVTGGYSSSFHREGISSAGIDPAEFRDWLSKVSETDVCAVEAFLIGECTNREAYPRMIRERSRAPVICLNDYQSLDQTLELFAAGVDDVLRKPVHVREILARVGAINRRAQREVDHVDLGVLCVYFDGRDPEVSGDPLPLPRRERRILEYIVKNRGRRVTKSQIFNAIYGLFDENVDENVVESHISKLRKKLKHRLGFDPIDSKRYLGYCLSRDCMTDARHAARRSSLAPSVQDLSTDEVSEGAIACAF